MMNFKANSKKGKFKKNSSITMNLKPNLKKQIAEFKKKAEFKR